ncbi:1384_t:CDS:2, partial [Funneliformis geosporum]
SSYVWEYFQIENRHDVCKIIIFLKGEEVECKRNYKYDGGTGNIKQHLQIKHGISSPDDLQLNYNEKIQTHINKMIRKVTPHCALKQAELKQVTAECQRLDQAQIDLNQHNKINNSTESLLEINDDLETKRLLILRLTIEWLIATLHLQNEDSAKEDFCKLKSLMLKEHEWLLLNELVNVLKPFDELTSYFSEIQYTTLSVINSSFEALKFEFADGGTLTPEELNKIINENGININE